MLEKDSENSMSSDIIINPIARPIAAVTLFIQRPEDDIPIRLPAVYIDGRYLPPGGYEIPEEMIIGWQPVGVSWDLADPEEFFKVPDIEF